MDNNNTLGDLSPEEQQAFRKLRQHPSPPDDLEEKTVRLLQKKGILKSDFNHSKWIKASFYIAAALALIITGFGLGRWTSTNMNKVPKERMFMLLLYEPVQQKIEEENLVAEYGKWLGNLGSDGRVTGGEALKYDIWELVTDERGAFYEQALLEETSTVMSGYFLIEATDLEEARSIALQSPHVKYGGAIVIREVLLQQH